MDGELFKRLYKAAGEVASKSVGRRCTFSDFEVLLTFVLAAVANKPLSWACRRPNWPLWCWRVNVPTPSTMSRRTRTKGFRLLLLRLNESLRAALPGSSLKFLDGKALVVAGHSRDPDARWGKTSGGWSKGYKLHAILDACGRVELFAVTALDAGEATVAREVLCAALDLRGALVLADGNFDSNHLYGTVADAGGRLLAPRRKPGTGLGHGRRQHPDRLRAVEELERTPGGRADFDRLRLGVEQAFGLMTSLGLGAPPPWVRRLRRVRTWVMGRVIVYHAHLLLQDQRRAA
ncbi:MAG TPA: transposase [Myxococcota bacterium]|nr:transposase [Myxococcota bacterium]